MKRLSFLTFVMLVTCIVASCGTTSQMGGSGCFGYWNTDGPLRGEQEMQIAIVHILTGNVQRKLLVTLDEKLSGRPPRDGITSIDSSKIFLAPETDWLYSKVESQVLRSKVITGAIRCQFQTGMRSPTTLSAEFLYQSQFTRTVEPGWLFAGILTVRLLRLVFPICNITLTSCSMIGRANPFGFM